VLCRSDSRIFEKVGLGFQKEKPCRSGAKNTLRNEQSLVFRSGTIPSAGIGPQRKALEIARTLSVSVMTLHRWRKAPPGPRPALVATHEAGQPYRMRSGGDRIAELQLENSRLRRLVTDLLLEKIKLEEAGGTFGQVNDSKNASRRSKVNRHTLQA